MLKPLFLLVIHFLCQSVFCQPKSSTTSNLFLELGGNGGLLSINFDKRFTASNHGFGWRIGAGLGEGRPTHMFPEIAVTVPAGINYLLGKTAHHLEIGAGATFGSDGFGKKRKQFYFVPSLGYRYQPQTKHFNFRAFVCSFMGGGNAPWGGISFGKTF